MNDNSYNEEQAIDDAIWESLFEMAENIDVDEVPTYDNIDFYESDMKDNERFHTPEEALQALFGYPSFRPGQKDIIESILAGRDALAVMPTGAGKSICYQIPAMLLPGITLVISPLISLMQDQVKALNETGVSAAFINSSLSENAYHETVRRAGQGAFKIIYVAPERLVTDSFLELARNVQISMITVDEAHCISQWGQDFRPSYMKIVEFVRMLDNRPILSAFTATATENVREDIVCTLGLDNPFLLVTGFNRENLFFQVDKPKSKDQYILDYVSEHAGESGIIYCATRKNVDALYELLKSRGVSVAKYHAGMSAEDRKRMQNDFVYDYTSIVVATNAFGMGIDKSNVRFVIHYNMPQSMENYYQEAGRAGRDGLDSKCILLFSPQDIVINRFLLDHKVMSDLDPADAEIVRERDTKRLQVMERYCYTTECLRNYILKYFGENPEKPCEDCGNCLREFETQDMTDAAKNMINCVYEAKGRFGKTIIIDAVYGAKTARLSEIGAYNYKSYGKLSSINKNLLKRLMEQLILEGYLVVGDYQVIKMGDISALKNPDTKVMVKITDEDKLPEKATKPKKNEKKKESLTSAGYKLFDKLRELRLAIAREENMPPYIIFNDKTLIDMSAKVPMTQQEMLMVSGVGDNKYAKYGERFMAVITSMVEEYPELLKNKKTATTSNSMTVNADGSRIVNGAKVENAVSGEDGVEAGNGTISARSNRKARKQEFHLLREEAEQYVYVEYAYISEIKDEMNRICTRDNIKKVSTKVLLEILIDKEFITEIENEGRYEKTPTEKGYESGIKVLDKVSEKGNAYKSLVYPENIQKMLVEHFVELNFLGKNIESDGEEDAVGQERSWLAQKREKHAGAYMPWTEDEDQRLTEEFASKQFSIKELSEMHGRTTGAIVARLKKLKLIEA